MNHPSFEHRAFPFGCISTLARLLVSAAAICCETSSLASLGLYDSVIVEDEAGGLAPAARLTAEVAFTGANRAAFDFGAISGDATMEFVLTGNPAAIAGAGYLAVGGNANSNLRYAQWNNTRELGFTQLGVEDYRFSPGIASPTQPTHVAFTWNAGSRVMKAYVNGLLAGTRTGVTDTFSMPTGAGYLGGSPANNQFMVGTVFRVTTYDDLVSEEVIRRHADAFNGITRPPIIASFTATPTAVFTPGSSTLAWSVLNATGVSLNGEDVTAQSIMVVAPAVTTVYSLVASNTGGSVTSQVTVLVNPAPVIRSFTASRTHVLSGESITLSWDVLYGQVFTVSPGVGDVTLQTINGTGSIPAQPVSPITYTLTASSDFGTNSAEVAITLVQPANHLVISEFMAEDDSVPADEDGQFSGWIELFNPTAAPVNLAGHFLTDDSSDPTQWAFPSTNLPAGGYLLIFASGKDRAVAGRPLHTNFKLANAGEYLALVGPGPLLLHAFAPAYPSQRANLSFGILDGDLNERRFFGVRTPGARNSEAPVAPLPVEFSKPSGTFSEPFTVALMAPDATAVIRYTLDGSIPSATNGLVYAAPLSITNTTRLRAVALASGLASRISGASYLKLSSELTGYTSSLPIMVIDNFGSGVIQQKGWNSTGAGLKQVPRQAALWATFDRVNGSSTLTNAPQMSHLIGIRGRGAYSTEWRQKPYSVEAMDEHGEEAGVSPLGLPAHADWVLYFPDPDQNKDPALLFNTFAYELGAAMGDHAVRFRWVEAFINEDGGELSLADRRGVYAIIEKVARGKDRLDFERLSPDGTNGSWLININRMDPEPDTGWPVVNGATQPWLFHTAGADRVLQTPANTYPNPVPGDDQPRQYNAYFNFDNPNGYGITTNQRAAIEGWFNQFEDVLYNNAVWRDPANGYRRYLDARDFADYFILNVLTKNGDGLLISIFAWKGQDGRLRLNPGWDYNWNPYFVSGSATDALWHRSDRLWYARLFTDPDFHQLYLDRWWELRRGPMSNAALDAIIDRQAADISPEKSLLNGITNVTQWTDRLTQMKTWLKTRADWIDGNFLRPPSFNQNGGAVPDGFRVLITAANGTIYFTTDGSDPRVPGGAIAAVAQAYTGPLYVFAQTALQARVKNGTNWSGLTAAVFYPPQDLTALAITEIMYNPPAAGSWGSDDLEFLELKNTGTNTLNLGTLSFASGITFTFTNGTRLGPGEFFVLARNLAAFQSQHPGVTVNGLYTGRLDNGGETLRLATPLGDTVLDVTYNDRAPWPLAADGYGFSAVPRGGPDNSDEGAHWRASAQRGGSPGDDDPPPAVSPVILNEILSHTVLPEVDAVELFNPDAQAVDIGGWFLSDDGTVPKKFRIPDGTTIPAGGFLVFTETNFNASPGSQLHFALDSAGDAIYLTAADAAGNFTGFGHGVDFPAAAPGVSFGRHVNSIGEAHFPAQISTSLGGTNAGPIVGPVVIQEIMYHPEAGGDEFIELRNISASEVGLFDASTPTNTWRLNGLDYSFPTNVSLAPGGLLLIVATNPAAFRTRYAVPDSVTVLGPFGGSLQDNGEKLDLQRPGWLDTNGLVFLTVDEVRYDDKAPWPPGADGGGPSLQRTVSTLYGNDPAHWAAAAPTPGLNLVVGAPPVIVAHPQSQTIVAYQDATFSVTANGSAPLFYQWLLNDLPLASATNATLVLTNVHPLQAGHCRVVVYNSAGSILSDAAELKVRIPATIVQQPVSITTNLGRAVTLRVSAIGTGTLRYQWRFNGTALAGGTDALLTFTSVQPTNAGTYAVTVTDDIGPITSAPATLVVLVDPLVIQPPVSQTVVAGANVTLSVSVTNNATLPVGYRWRRNGQYLTNGSFVLNQTTCFFTVTNAQPQFNQYAVVITNAARPSGLISSSATLTFLPDTDGDGLPDSWEASFGLNSTNAADRALDTDGDRMLNWQEYVAGTDPADSLSYLRLDASGMAPGLAFVAKSNRTYTAEYSDALETGVWSILADIAARPTNRNEFIPDPNSRTNRFYRLVTPRKP